MYAPPISMTVKPKSIVSSSPCFHRPDPSCFIRMVVCNSSSRVETLGICRYDKSHKQEKSVCDQSHCRVARFALKRSWEPWDEHHASTIGRNARREDAGTLAARTTRQARAAARRDRIDAADASDARDH